MSTATRTCSSADGGEGEDVGVGVRANFSEGSGLSTRIVVEEGRGSADGGGASGCDAGGGEGVVEGEGDGVCRCPLPGRRHRQKREVGWDAGEGGVGTVVSGSSRGGLNNLHDTGYMSSYTHHSPVNA